MDINDGMDVGQIFKGGRRHKDVANYPYLKTTEFLSHTQYIGAM